MIAVIFEALPNEGQQENYLATAEHLRAYLITQSGFISIERFQSLSEPTKLLSLSFWQDETAVRLWREQSDHRQAQQAGQESVFADYRLRVAQVMRDYGRFDRAQAPAD
ncbi:antibiotic biosynthesis monooxygenase [Saccharospirillum sp. MSK14-1]|uniref:antibiotic biosynthesis monooxygenase family protein n=1 Tax=Saccharospirillum sp. MSK14-1 TaxID=1897632 RepID=UPI000D38695D|nr:antibiotic biosynthesis monooxygenase [Saccharospirillum sp. MSK14-1]PTY38829.1 antibiotic biosynthesis monooxygenase [Saccharospirillum sp. MSK14-1]